MPSLVLPIHIYGFTQDCIDNALPEMLDELLPRGLRRRLGEPLAEA
jgi:hypothetical protein